VAIVQIGAYVWVGTSKANVLVVDSKSCQIVHHLDMQQTQAAPQETKLILVGDCIWVSRGNEIHIISSKVFILHLFIPF
jgi:hypothetical protein